MSEREIPRAWRSAADVIGLVRDLGARSLSVDIDQRFADGAANVAAIEAMASFGLFGLTLPSRYGGLGRDYVALAAACEELGKIDTAHQVALTVHLALAAMCILQWGSDTQRDEWLPLLARGQRLATFALTEPGAGSDVAALRMRARPVDGGYLLNGEKTWISGVSDADVVVMFATVDPALRHRGITSFIVPMDTRGLSITALHGKFGLRAGDTGAIACHDVFVPGNGVLGEVGEGFVVALSALGNGLFTVGAGALGIAAECRRLAAAFLREIGDTGLGLHGAALARMHSRETRARALLAAAAELKNAGMPNGRETGLAKWSSARAAHENASDALGVVQAHSTGEHAALLRHWANAKGAVIYGGTSEIHQVMQAGYALGSRVERPFRRPSPAATDLA
ncbi:MAG TPA: acyl-CoA dehydrogenase family protein [Thermomicrobiales bacterium]|nr:acyl-CoA dehydrogenase family protein [Thermomicrobiales bacterium]